MADIAKFLKESLNLTEEAQKLIQETWYNKLSEAREEIAAELRSEFAQKFEHDKDLIIESMDKLMQGRLAEEIQNIANDRKLLAEARAKYKTTIREHCKTLNKFISESVKKEVLEHRQERSEFANGLDTLENFVLKQLAEEIKEFRSDKKQLHEQRVKLVTEGKKQLVEAKRKFVSEAASLVSRAIDSSLKKEIKQFKEDIEISRQNDFGRKIFEAVASEYLTSYLNEGSEVKKLMKVLSEKDKTINEAANVVEKQSKLVESLNAKLNATRDQLARDRVMNRLLSPLGKEKRVVMAQLLESVKTVDLEKAFNKYLPAVLNEKTNTQTTAKKNLSENVTEKTGDRAPKASPTTDDLNTVELDDIKRLAGLK